MEGEDDNIDFDQMFTDMFGGKASGKGSSFSFAFEDMDNFFDDFTTFLGGSKAEQKAYDKFMRDLTKGSGSKRPKGRSR